MARRNVGFGRFATRRQGPRRETVWLSVPIVENVLTGAPTAILSGVLDAGALALRPFTVIRVRGIMHLRSDQAAATESFGAALGYAVVSEQASAIGVTAVPTPITDRGSDLFFVYQEIVDRIEIGSGAGTGVPVNTGRFMEFESKAMRKVNDDEDMIITVENELNGCNLIEAARFLVKLH